MYIKWKHRSNENKRNIFADFMNNFSQRVSFYLSMFKCEIIKRKKTEDKKIR